MSKNEAIKKVDFEIIWEDKPAGLWERFLTLLHLNFVTYQITNDELVIKTGFLTQRINTVELYLLKDPDMTMTLVQRMLGVGTISVSVDTHDGANSDKPNKKIVLRNIKEAEKVRKILRDAIENDVMERKITYFDKV